MQRARRQGFTLVELLIVVLIVGILAVIMVPRFVGRSAPRLSAVLAPDSVVSTGASGPLVVRVESPAGRPQRGVPVEFRATDGGGSIAPATVESDSAGLAAAVWQAGPGAGATTFSASVRGREPRLMVTVRVSASAAAPAATPEPGQPQPQP